MNDNKLEKAKLLFEVLKSLVLGIFAIFTVIAFTHPQSKISITATNEAISRERAKLVLEWLKEEDTEKRNLAFSLIDVSYGKLNDGWLRSVEQELQAYSLRRSLPPMNKRYKELAELIEGLEMKSQEEINGVASGNSGYGPRAHAIRKQLESLKSEFESVGSEIERSTNTLSVLNKAKAADTKSRAADLAALCPK